MLRDLEKRKEEIIEEFMEAAVHARFEAVEQVKARSKKEKMAKEIEKQLIAKSQAQCDKIKKEGLQ